MKIFSIFGLLVVTLWSIGCGEKPVEPTIEAPPSNSGNVQGLDAPLSGQGTSTRGQN